MFLRPSYGLMLLRTAAPAGVSMFKWAGGTESWGRKERLGWVIFCGILDPGPFSSWSCWGQLFGDWVLEISPGGLGSSGMEKAGAPRRLPPTLVPAVPWVFPNTFFTFIYFNSLQSRIWKEEPEPVVCSLADWDPEAFFCLQKLPHLPGGTEVGHILESRLSGTQPGVKLTYCFQKNGIFPTCFLFYLFESSFFFFFFTQISAKKLSNSPQPVANTSANVGLDKLRVLHGENVFLTHTGRGCFSLICENS